VYGTGIISGALTDGEVGGELVLERGEQLLVPRVRLQVHLALVRRAGHGHLDELALGGRVLPDPARRHRRPPHQPRPASNTNANQSDPGPNRHTRVNRTPHTRACVSERSKAAYLGAGAARGDRPPSAVEARLRSGSGVEPGRRSVRAVSSKSRPEDDSVELRAVPSDMAVGLRLFTARLRSFGRRLLSLAPSVRRGRRGKAGGEQAEEVKVVAVVIGGCGHLSTGRRGFNPWATSRPVAPLAGNGVQPNSPLTPPYRQRWCGLAASTPSLPSGPALPVGHPTAGRGIPIHPIAPSHLPFLI
jgi:hypothetical protein